MKLKAVITRRLVSTQSLLVERRELIVNCLAVLALLAVGVV